MIKRHARLLGPADQPAGSEDLPRGTAAATSLEAIKPDQRVAAGAPLTKPEELTWWDWTVFLLHTAAEIEHALMVQYLYAAYSLPSVGSAGPGAPPDAANLVRRWRRAILAVAREEMGHFVTVQNLLRLIGGPLNVEREDFPFRPFLYPFPFQLEPLTKASLAKYAAAEMPAKPDRPPELIDEVIRRASGAAGGMAVNRVGALYEELARTFADDTKLLDRAFRPDSGGFQARRDDWYGSSVVIVREMTSRADALGALQEVDAQGEGWDIPAPSAGLSHFDRFLDIYLAFPDPADGGAAAEWTPALPLPTNPTTGPVPDGNADDESGVISHPGSRRWAHLFNLRYRMLLVYLLHALHRDEPIERGGVLTPRGHLRDWVFLEMRGRPQAGLRGLARKLTTLPRTTAGTATVAGPPFELPYTFSLPDRERDRWHLHLTLIESSRTLIDAIRAESGADPVLEELEAIDHAARVLIDSQLTETEP
jgi:ferritin-like protein